MKVTKLYTFNSNKLKILVNIVKREGAIGNMSIIVFSKLKLNNMTAIEMRLTMKEKVTGRTQSIFKSSHHTSHDSLCTDLCKLYFL